MLKKIIATRQYSFVHDTCPGPINLFVGVSMVWIGNVLHHNTEYPKD